MFSASTTAARERLSRRAKRLRGAVWRRIWRVKLRRRWIRCRGNNFMKKILFLFLILSQAAFAQVAVPRYEVEMLKNPNSGGKDTREVNAILVFEKEALRITSRRKKETYKE